MNIYRLAPFEWWAERDGIKHGPYLSELKAEIAMGISKQCIHRTNLSNGKKKRCMWRAIKNSDWCRRHHPDSYAATKAKQDADRAKRKTSPSWDPELGS